jgi:hypothetical protein
MLRRGSLFLLRMPLGSGRFFASDKRDGRADKQDEPHAGSFTRYNEAEHRKFVLDPEHEQEQQFADLSMNDNDEGELECYFFSQLLLLW